MKGLNKLEKTIGMLALAAGIGTITASAMIGKPINEYKPVPLEKVVENNFPLCEEYFIRKNDRNCYVVYSREGLNIYKFKDCNGDSDIETRFHGIVGAPPQLTSWGEIDYSTPQEELAEKIVKWYKTKG